MAWIFKKAPKLDIAEILYDTGEVHYRYSRKMSKDGTKWIREGAFVEYHRDGSVASEGQYDDGLETGLWKDYHENGVLAAEGEYREGEEVGVWRFYDEQGELESEEDYDAEEE
jgi:antitoxin component YwqK of YwqJK toxin-antitoxin module